LVLFLGLGMLVGTDGLGWIDFNDYALARDVGIVALALILFEGGLNTGFDEIRPVLGVAISLAIVGTLLTAAITGFAAAGLFGFSTKEGLLVGSIIAATDGAAIFAVLRDSTLRRRLALALEGEAGLNDAIAVLLVLACIDWILKPHYGIGDALVLFVRELGVGVGIGVVTGWLAVQALRRVRLATAGLYPVASLAVAAIAYGAAAALEGSGFVAVYLAGLALGSASIPAKQTVANFHQGLAGSRSWPCSSPSACSCSPASSATSRSRAPRWRWCSRWSRGRLRCGSRRCSPASAPPSAWRSDGAACAARCRSCWRRSPSSHTCPRASKT